MEAHHSAYWLRHGNVAVAGVPALGTAPSASTDGVPIPSNMRDSLGKAAIAHVAAGARSFNVEIWGYKDGAQYINASSLLTSITGYGSAAWFHLGTISVSAAADANEAHQIEGCSAFTRLAAQITSAVGAPTVYVDFGFSRSEREEA